jgi:fatty acid desaturase
MNNNDLCIGLKRLRLALVILLLGFVPAMVIIGAINMAVLKNFNLTFVCAGVWGLLYLATFAKVAFYKCPNCHRRFHRYVLWSRRCARCGFDCDLKSPCT